MSFSAASSSPSSSSFSVNSSPALSTSHSHIPTNTTPSIASTPSSNSATVAPNTSTENKGGKEIKAFEKSTIQKLKKVVDFLLEHPAFVSGFSSVDQSEFDRIAKVFLEIALKANTSLSLIRAVINGEFLENRASPSVILRGNSMASKLMGFFVRQFGTQYLKSTLNPLVTEVMRDHTMSLEVDPRKLKEGENIDKNRKKLLETTSQFLDRISSTEMLNEMPRSIRALAGFTAELSREYAPERTGSLVGGFIMLRFFNPAIITPQVYGVSDKSPDERARRNLTLITKLLQNVSNAKTFHEDFMLPLNDYVLEKAKELEKYYQELSTDPNQVAGKKPWHDVSGTDRKDIYEYDIDIKDYAYFFLLFSENKDKVIQKLQNYESPPLHIDKFIDLMAALPSPHKEPEDIPEIYYSPLDSFSRLVYMFCVDNNIEVNLRRVDVFKKEDQTEAFRMISPESKLPVLRDHDPTTKKPLVLLETHSILRFLMGKYYLPKNNWFPTADPSILRQANADKINDSQRQPFVIEQYLDWLNLHLYQPLNNLFWRKVLGYVTTEALEHLLMKTLAESMNTLDRHLASHPFLLGDQCSVIDYCIVFVLTLFQMVEFDMKCFPNLRRLSGQIQKQCNKWQEVNFEFDNFVQYCNTSKKGLPSVSHSVVFPNRTPKEVYNSLMDPQIHSTLQYGSYIYNNEVSQAFSNDQIGGTFSSPWRSGVNIMLIPYEKIVQKSSISGWPVGHCSTETFEIKKNDLGTFVYFTQIDVPPDGLKESDNYWDQLWNNLGGVRTTDIDVTVFFCHRLPSKIYAAMLDQDKLSRFSKKKCSIEKEKGGTFSLFDRLVTGENLELNESRLIVQKWRVSDWPEGHFSTLKLALKEMEGGTRMKVTQTNVPIEKEKVTLQIQKRSIWRKLDGTVCQDISQTVLFQKLTPKQVYDLYMDSSKISKLLGSKCTNTGTLNGEYTLYDRFVSGSNLLLSPPYKIVQTHRQKDWSRNHSSIVTLVLEDFDGGALLTLDHVNVPTKKVKVVTGKWEEFWEALGGVQTALIRKSFSTPHPPSLLFSTLISSEAMAVITKAKCSIPSNPQQGMSFSMYDDIITGTYRQVTWNQVIEKTWRAENWQMDYYSKVRIEISERDGGSIISFLHKEIPAARFKDIGNFWDRFWKRFLKIVTRISNDSALSSSFSLSLSPFPPSSPQSSSTSVSAFSSSSGSVSSSPGSVSSSSLPANSLSSIPPSSSSSILSSLSGSSNSWVSSSNQVSPHGSNSTPSASGGSTQLHATHHHQHHATFSVSSSSAASSSAPNSPLLPHHNSQGPTPHLHHHLSEFSRTSLLKRNSRMGFG